jgi:gas vesicle protein
VAFACLVLRRRVTNFRKKGATVAIGQDIGAPNGGSATEQAQQKVQDAGRQAQQQAQHAAGQARNRIREQVDQRSTDAGEQISSQASDLRTVADQLREQGKDKPAQLAERAAQYTERVGSYLKRQSPIGSSVMRRTSRAGGRGRSLPVGSRSDLRRRGL